MIPIYRTAVGCSPDPGDWGPAILVEPGSSRLVIYDDDDDDGCGAIVYDHIPGPYRVVDRAELIAVPDWSPAWLNSIGLVPRGRGHEPIVYAILLSPHRCAELKVGRSENLPARLASYRTASPFACLIGLWDGELEHRAHDAAGAWRVGETEVFDCGADLWIAMAEVHRAIGVDRSDRHERVESAFLRKAVAEMTVALRSRAASQVSRPPSRSQRLPCGCFGFVWRGRARCDRHGIVPL